MKNPPHLWEKINVSTPALFDWVLEQPCLYCKIYRQGLLGGPLFVFWLIRFVFGTFIKLTGNIKDTKDLFIFIFI